MKRVRLASVLQGIGLLTLCAALGACVVTAPAKAVWNGAKLAGKGVYYTGKGMWQVGKMTVRVADGVLDGTERMLRLTILTAHATGVVVRTTREVNALALEAELAALERTDGVVEVIVTRAEDRAVDWAADEVAQRTEDHLDETF